MFVVRSIVDLVVELVADDEPDGPHEIAHCEDDQDHSKYSEEVTDHYPPHNVVVISKGLGFGLLTFNRSF